MLVGAVVAVGTGIFVGAVVGTLVGTTVGAIVGTTVIVGAVVGVGICVGPVVGTVVGTGVPVGAGVLFGCACGLLLFRGKAVEKSTKSVLLLSLSNPLPKVDSEPPVLRVSSVELAEAFLTILSLASGLVAKPLASTSTAVPNPTLSTTVTPASLNNVTVLFVVIALDEDE